ncbi:MAG: 2-C-methyl-D-erythritol 2,4-cyclodiphosphate synthase [Candidatus Hydrogenedentota bacterium]|nr:MAG: 2-C-methyl-D-erythritol 2,4-cyclodiphosphate synthase [Candidatus Hydrogenedentota bacterium]
MTRPSCRIGFGYDSHKIDSEKPLVIGGVTLPELPGLSGHSDADVLTHAVIDALLSAAGEKDIGELFPNTDPAFKNASSLDLLRRLPLPPCRFLQIDATLVTDLVRVSAIKAEIADNYRAILGPRTQITIKGKSSEGLGFIGRGEGIAAFAVALLETL